MDFAVAYKPLPAACRSSNGNRQVGAEAVHVDAFRRQRHPLLPRQTGDYQTPTLTGNPARLGLQLSREQPENQGDRRSSAGRGRAAGGEIRYYSGPSVQQGNGTLG